MQPLDWGTLFASAPNIVTAVIFGYFVLKLLERQDKRDDKREASWQTFMDGAREQYAASVSEVAGEVKLMAEAVRETGEMVARHDAWERGDAAMERSAAVTAAAEAVRVAALVASDALKKGDSKPQATP